MGCDVTVLFTDRTILLLPRIGSVGWSVASASHEYTIVSRQRRT